MIWKFLETGQKIFSLNILEDNAFLQKHQSKTVIVYE